MHRRPSSQAVQNVARCSRVWHSQCLCSCMLFNKKAYILTKRALSSSLSQCDAACPASEQCRAAAHTGYSRASLDGASVDRAVKAAMSVPERVGSYSGDLALATRCDKARIYPSIQTQTTPFQWRGAVSNIASKRAVSETRGMQSARKRCHRESPSERAGVRVLQPLFRGTQKRRGAPPDSGSQTHQQSTLQASVQDANAETDPGANSPRGLVCVRGFKGRVLSHSDSTASQTFSEVCVRRHSVPILCSPVRAGFGPTYFLEVHGCSTFPPQSERDAHSQLSGRLADFSSVPRDATQPYRHAASTLGVPRAMCQHAEEHSHPESVYNISGSVLRLSGDASPPLSEALSGHFVFPAPFQTRQLCSLEGISEAAGTHGVCFSGMSSGLTTHAPAAVMAEISSPVDSVDFGPSEHRGFPRLHRSSEAVAQPRSLQQGSSPGLGNVARCGNDGRIESRLGSSVRRHAGFGAVVRTSEPVAHKPLGAGSSVLSSKGFSPIRTDNTSVVSYINHQGGVRSRALCKQAANLLLWVDCHFLSIRAVHIPGLLNRGADMLSRNGIPQGEWRLHPESVRMIWTRYGRAEVDLFATSENAHCPLFFSLSHSPLDGDALGVAPEPGVVEPSCVAASGISEELSSLHSRVLDTLSEARAPSTRRLYALKWGVFVKWCCDVHINPATCTVSDVLRFLQHKLDSGSLPSTLKVYVAAIASFRSPLGGQSIGRHALVVSFLKGARRLHPPRPPSVPP